MGCKIIQDKRSAPCLDQFTGTVQSVIQRNRIPIGIECRTCGTHHMQCDIAGTGDLRTAGSFPIGRGFDRSLPQIHGRCGKINVAFLKARFNSV